MASNKTKLDKAGVVNYLSVDDMTSGVDLRHSPTLMQPNRSRVLRNVSLQEPGAWQPYPGWQQFSTTSLGAGRIQGAKRIYLKGSTFTLAAFGGKIYKPSDVGVFGASVYTGLNATNPVDFPNDRDIVGAFDGATVPQGSIDGTNWRLFGVQPPAAAPTLTAVSGGTLVATNAYEVSYAYMNAARAVESNESPVSLQITIANPNQTIRVALVASTDPQVDTIAVYARNVTAGETVRRRVGTTANTTGNYDIASANWLSGTEAPTDHNVPVAMSFATVWRNRWWGVDATTKNRIHFTQVFQPLSWPTLFYIDIPFERGDTITALVPLGDTLIVFGQVKVFLIIGQTSLDFEVRPSAGAVSGALGFRAVTVVEQGIVHVAAGGVLLFDGATDRLLTQDLDPGWRDMLARAAVNDLAQIAAMYHDPRKEVHVAVPLLYGTASPGEWVLDLTRTRLQQDPAWTATTRAIGGYVSFDGAEARAGDRGRLFSWDMTAALLNEEVTGTSANGNDLVSEYEGAALVGAQYRTSRYIDVHGEYTPSVGQFSIEVLVDQRSIMSVVLGTTGAMSNYGTAIYGVSTYASSSRKQWVTMLPSTAEGRAILVRATLRGQGGFKWYGYAISVVPEPQFRGFPS